MRAQSVERGPGPWREPHEKDLSAGIYRAQWQEDK